MFCKWVGGESFICWSYCFVEVLCQSIFEFMLCASDVKLLCDAACSFVVHDWVATEVVILAFNVDFRPGIANCTVGCQNWVSLRSCLVSRRDLLGSILKGWGTCVTIWMFVATTNLIYLVKLWFTHGLHAFLSRIFCIWYKSMLFLSGFFSAFSFLLLRFSTCIPFPLALFLL